MENRGEGFLLPLQVDAKTAVDVPHWTIERLMTTCQLSCCLWWRNRCHLQQCFLLLPSPWRDCFCPEPPRARLILAQLLRFIDSPQFFRSRSVEQVLSKPFRMWPATPFVPKEKTLLMAQYLSVFSDLFKVCVACAARKLSNCCKIAENSFPECKTALPQEEEEYSPGSYNLISLRPKCSNWRKRAFWELWIQLWTNLS